MGLYPAIEELANWVNKSERLYIDVIKSGEFFRFDVKKELAVFRVVQELMNNAIKHADATHLSIHLRFTHNTLAVLVRDNGKGFDLKERGSSGLGLKNLESRVEMAGGKLKLKSRMGDGTTALLHLRNHE